MTTYYVETIYREIVKVQADDEDGAFEAAISNEDPDAVDIEALDVRVMKE
jgi:hypothetical protein